MRHGPAMRQSGILADTEYRVMACISGSKDSVWITARLFLRISPAFSPETPPWYTIPLSSGIRSVIGYRKALKTYGGAIRSSTVTFGEKIVNDTPHGIMTMPYEAVKTIHFLKKSFVIEDAQGVGILCFKDGFGEAAYMDCVNFLCEQCPNLEL